MSGNNDIVATADKDGFLVLTSASGLNIGVKLVLKMISLSSIRRWSSVFSANRLHSVRCINSHIRWWKCSIEDGETDAHTGTDKLGLMTQSEELTTVTGLAVGQFTNKYSIRFIRFSYR